MILFSCGTDITDRIANSVKATDIIAFSEGELIAIKSDMIIYCSLSTGILDTAIIKLKNDSVSFLNTKRNDVSSYKVTSSKIIGYSQKGRFLDSYIIRNEIYQRELNFEGEYELLEVKSGDLLSMFFGKDSLKYANSDVKSKFEVKRSILGNYIAVEDDLGYKLHTTNIFIKSKKAGAYSCESIDAFGQYRETKMIKK